MPGCAVGSVGHHDPETISLEKQVVSGFVSPERPGSCSRHFEVGRGRPNGEWWATKQRLLSKGAKLPETKVDAGRLTLKFPSLGGFYELLCRTFLNNHGVLSHANQGLHYESVYL